MTSTILIDGYNLGLEKGTGIATYARNLSYAVHALGYRVDILYGLRTPPTEDPLLREAAFFDPPRQRPRGLHRLALHRLRQVATGHFGVGVQEVPLSGRVIPGPTAARLPYYDRIWNGSDLFGAAHAHFNTFGRLLPVRMPDPPRIAHWTYPIPIRIPGAKNIYTLHDLVPLRLPYTTLDRSRFYRALVAKLVETADHIVTVSERSKQDICDLFDVPGERITNAYQAASLPESDANKPVEVVRREIEGLFGLTYRGYFLFYGAIEPKKNVGRLIEAYLAANTATPLLIVGSAAWKSDQELQLLQSLDPATLGNRVRRLDYVPRNLLVTLIRGAKAVLFPSLYEGFGLPVLEAMTLGTPVLTSREGATPEIAGDAGLLVDPYDTAAITEGILSLDGDRDLCASLEARGPQRAEFFSAQRFQERLKALYEGL